MRWHPLAAMVLASVACGKLAPDSPDSPDTSDAGDASCAAPKWDSAPTKLGSSAGFGLATVDGYQNGGRALALWASGGELAVTRRMTDGTWTARETVVPSVALSGATLAAGADGSAVVVWGQHRSSAADPIVYLNASFYTSGWSLPAELNPNEHSFIGTAPSGARAAIDNQGNTFVVWVETDTFAVDEPPTVSIEAQRFAPKSGGSGLTTISAAGDARKNNPSIAVDADGNAIVVWSEVEQISGTMDLTERILAARFDAASGTWAPPVHLDQCPPTSCALIEEHYANEMSAPKVAFDPHGRAIAVWQQRTSGVRPWAARFTSGTWQPAERLDANVASTYFANAPALAVDASGNAIAVWQVLDATNSLFANRWSGGSWHGAVKIDASSAAELPTVALDDAGDGFVVWDDGSAIWGAHVSASTQTLDASTPIFSSGNVAEDARLAFAHGDCASALLVWDGPTATTVNESFFALTYR